MRSSVRRGTARTPLPRIFKGRPWFPRRPEPRGAMPRGRPHLRITRFRGRPRPSRKRENPPGGQGRRLRARSRRRSAAVSASGNVRSRFPFAARARRSPRTARAVGPPPGFRPARTGRPVRPGPGRASLEFSGGLGSTNPGAIAVLREPFSTSAFEVCFATVVARTFATTTEICTTGRSDPPRGAAFSADRRIRLLVRA